MSISPCLACHAAVRAASRSCASTILGTSTNALFESIATFRRLFPCSDCSCASNDCIRACACDRSHCSLSISLLPFWIDRLVCLDVGDRAIERVRASYSIRFVGVVIRASGPRFRGVVGLISVVSVSTSSQGSLLTCDDYLIFLGHQGTIPVPSHPPCIFVRDMPCSRAV